MVGAKVFSKAFGSGIVIDHSGSSITVHFDAGEKKFLFPSAFDKYLVTEDPELLQEISELKETAEEAKEVPIPAAPLPAPISSPERKSKAKSISRKNIAFKCTYCDGGRSELGVGFKDVCSDETIRYNIKKAKHVWCMECRQCNELLSGKMSREELDESFVCYESTMLKDWKCSAGVVQHGDREGTPMKLLGVQKNSLAVLTTRDPNAMESTRYIFAIFLVDESWEGDGRVEGFVSGNEDWRMELTPKEAHKLLFWNYYFCPNKPEKIVFGSGLHRYISDVQAAQILRDIAGIMETEERREFAESFFEHFCKITGLDTAAVPAAAGALTL